MYPYLLIKKYNCPKGTNWVTPGKAPLAAAEAHKLRSGAKYSGTFGAQIKFWVHNWTILNAATQWNPGWSSVSENCHWMFHTEGIPSIISFHCAPKKISSLVPLISTTKHSVSNRAFLHTSVTWQWLRSQYQPDEIHDAFLGCESIVNTQQVHSP